MQTFKITPIKKLVWNEVIFLEDKEELKNLSKLITKAFFQNEILESGENFTVEKACHNINLIENHTKIAETIFTVLTEVSKKNTYGFIINFSSQSDFISSGNDSGVVIMISLEELHFHPELILDGRCLINDFSNKNLNRSYFSLVNDFLVDCCSKDKTLADEVFPHGSSVSNSLFPRCVINHSVKIDSHLTICSCIFNNNL